MSAEAIFEALGELDEGLIREGREIPARARRPRKTLLLEDCDLYLDAVLDAVEERFRPEGLYGYATSFGGYMFLKRLAKRAAARLSLCPPKPWPNTVRYRMALGSLQYSLHLML